MVRRNRPRHGLVHVHDVVGRHLRQLLGAPGGELVRAVVLPVGALVMKIGAQESVDALGAMPHLRVGRTGRIVPRIYLCASGLYLFHTYFFKKTGKRQ